MLSKICQTQKDMFEARMDCTVRSCPGGAGEKDLNIGRPFSSNGKSWEELGCLITQKSTEQIITFK